MAGWLLIFYRNLFHFNTLHLMALMAIAKFGFNSKVISI